MSKPRILIVDDEPKVAFFFQKNLELGGSGYHVDAVNSGQEALEALRENPYDLLITDLRMPKMNGLELLRRVREISTSTKTILVTAYGTENVWQEAENLQTFRALSKPLKIPDLLEAVRDALKVTSTPQVTKKGASELLVITGEHFEALAGRLESLRVDVGARTVVLADTAGHLLAYTGSADDLNISEMMALLGGTMAAAGELTHQFKYKKPIHLSYFEGPPYDLYAANVNCNLFLTIFYDRRNENTAVSRIGLVWLYTRRALIELQEMLGQQAVECEADPASALAEGFAQSLQGELDSLFGFEKEDVAIELALTSATAVSTPQAKYSAPITNNSRPAASLLKADHITYTKVSQMLARFEQQTQLVIEFHMDSLNIPLPTLLTRLILQTVNAGLKNVYQHSQATILGISFVQQDDYLRGRIVDNGISFMANSPPPLRTLGKLKEQIEQLGGQLTLQGRFNYGTTLMFQLPLNKKKV